MNLKHYIHLKYYKIIKLSVRSSRLRFHEKEAQSNVSLQHELCWKKVCSMCILWAVPEVRVLLLGASSSQSSTLGVDSVPF